MGKNAPSIIFSPCRAFLPIVLMQHTCQLMCLFLNMPVSLN